MKKLYVAGIGPGSADGMTGACKSALAGADIIAGYTKYVELIRPLFPDKPVLDTPMTREVERCRAALALADSGKTVALVSSGDAGVYGMAGPVLELTPEFPDVSVELIPGVSAAMSGAALLGAPLTHDFAVISLSDLLTPWPTIAKRLECSANGDFCIVLYNPGSMKRSDHLKRACDILLKYKSPKTLCGIARNIAREGERYTLLTLDALREAEADMFTTVFIGNAHTREVMGRMVTPRGYSLE